MQPQEARGASGFLLNERHRHKVHQHCLNECIRIWQVAARSDKKGIADMTNSFNYANENMIQVTLT